MNILHITPHLGGGIGRVMLNYFSKAKDEHMYVHEVICLDYANENALQTAKLLNLRLSDKMSGSSEVLNSIAKADIVLLHWWNHPLLYDFLVHSKFPPSRVIMWSHVSGLFPPYIYSEELIDFSDFFIFSSPVSFEADEIKHLPDSLKDRLDVVWSSSGTEMFKGFKKEPHDGFIVGFNGTVDYAKLHPDFAKICSMINLSNIHFIICSNDSQDKLNDDLTSANIRSFEIHRNVSNIISYLAKYDVFGYPLQPKHFGTCEQAIGEAMMAEVVPVTLNNPAEKYIIENGTTGIIANTYEEYAKAIEYLYYNPGIRLKMAAKAKVCAEKKYSLTTMIAKWNQIFSKAMQLPKKNRRWNSRNKSIKGGAAVFIASLGGYGQIFEQYIDAFKNSRKEKLLEAKNKIINLFRSNPQWKSESKGGVKQYLRFFPNDLFLKHWNTLLDDNGNK